MKDRFKKKTAHIQSYVPRLPKKVVDYSTYQSVRINEETVILIPPGADPEKEKEKYLKRIKK